MIRKTVLEELDVKISLILEKYESLKEENHLLKEMLTSNREIESNLRQEILKLKEDEELRDLELEDIATRINRSMSLHLSNNNISVAS
jgi:hypothetical protein